jgi:mannan endo-1,4-beta-mannosidase
MLQKVLIVIVFFVAQVATQVPDWNTCFGDDTCASSHFVCCVAPADVHSNKSTCRPLSYCGNPPNGTTVARETQHGKASNSTTQSWAGTNHFFLHTLPDSDQQQAIDILYRANVKVIRLFISTIHAGAKNTNARQTMDIEHFEVGKFLDNTVLNRIDALLPRLERAGIKAIIALHDRYMLGTWGVDAYVKKYNLDVVGTGFDGKANQHLRNFYDNVNAMKAFDKRVAHILSFPSKSYPGKKIGQLSNVISSFNVQNEPMGHLAKTFPKWVCNRAENAKKYTKIPISTGGGTDYAQSIELEYFKCPFIDHVGIHTYELDLGQASKYLQEGHKLALAHGKKIVLEEFGATGNKASKMKPLIQYSNQLGIPWMVWQTLKPNNPSDFEFWTEDASMWALLETEASKALRITSAVAP